MAKAKLPVAVIQNGSLANERFVLSNVDALVEDLQKASVGSPAVIVLGEVVKEHPVVRARTRSKPLRIRV